MPEVATDRPGPELTASNTPQAFWRLTVDPAPTDPEWSAAIAKAAGELPAAARRDGDDAAALLFNTLGEGQFGPDHWRLGLPRRAYYRLKPLLPRSLTTRLRSLHRGVAEQRFELGWPEEPRWAAFLAATVGHLAKARGLERLPYVRLWPEGRQFAFVLTHDIETAKGQAFAARVADLEEGLGFRSSFNFVTERYPLDQGLIADLRGRGFEIGVHGCRHDGRLFSSRRRFLRRAARINRHLRELGAVGFRSPLTHRHPGWMQDLEMEYDLSFFDSDPYEPIPGGVMTVWPFRIGRFWELPYTLPQDHTLAAVLGERTPKLWLEKLAFIRSVGGMALLNSHPDYLREGPLWPMYEQFLRQVREGSDEQWHALPREVARWWRARAEAAAPLDVPGAVPGVLEIEPDGRLSLAAAAAGAGHRLAG